MELNGDVPTEKEELPLELSVSVLGRGLSEIEEFLEKEE